MEYDFKGNVVSLHKKFTIDYDMLIDWDDAILLQGEFTTETEYDALNRPVSVVQPDNSVVGYQYDKGGLLQKVMHGVTEHITNITYNPKGQRENIYYGNNTKTRYDYDPLNFRLTRLLTTRNTGQDVLQDLNYEFDSVGNITKINDDAQQTHYFNNQVIAPVSTFQYDALYRLVKATGRELSALTAPNENDFVNDIPCPNPAANAMQNYTHNYQYDKLGNMLNDAWKSYQYAIINNYLLGNDNVANQFTYDAHGNVLSMPHLSSMDWDWKDQLIGASNGTFTSYYNYDVQGNRTRKVVEKGNIIETRYYIGGYEVFRKEISGVLDIERSTVNIADDEKVFVRIDTETGQNPVILYVFDNHLGSSCLELDEVGAIISYEEYHAFGSTSYRSGRSEVEVSLKRFKYNGKERDEETGMYCYGARYYAAWLCRFVSCDPLAEKYPNFSPYVYCADNPIKYIDPDGKDFVNVHTERKEEAKVKRDEASSRLDVAKTAFAEYEGKTRSDIKADGKLKEFKVVNSALKDAQKIFDKAETNYQQEIFFESVINQVIEDFKTVNPTKFEEWNKWDPHGTGVINIPLTAQNERIKMVDKSGMPTGQTTTEQVNMSLAGNNIIGVKNITLTVIKMDGVVKIPASTSVMVHALGHMVGGKPHDETAANKYQQEQYDYKLKNQKK